MDNPERNAVEQFELGDEEAANDPIMNRELSEKIVKQIHSVCNNHVLERFFIMNLDNDNNRSPVRQVDNEMYIDAWCIKHIYQYAYQEVFNIRRKTKLFPDRKKLDAYLTTALLINPEIQTFWNMRKELFRTGFLEMEGEFYFTRLVLSDKPKSAPTFNYRKWVLEKYSKFNPIEELLLSEFRVNIMAGSSHPNNYIAWNHCLFILEKRLLLKEPEKFLKTLWSASNYWIVSHISDYSGLAFHQTLLKEIVDTGCRINRPPFPDENEPNLSAFQLSILENFDRPAYYNFHILELVLIEFKKNAEMMKTFSHCQYEALWWHRRFITYYFLEVIPTKLKPTRNNQTQMRNITRHLRAEYNLPDEDPIVVDKKFITNIFISLNTKLYRTHNFKPDVFFKRYDDWVKKRYNIDIPLDTEIVHNMECNNTDR